jgi:predicted enzyme related to lactoylglutathione lyase
MSNLVVHFEIHASEPQRLIDFYGELLGWRFERFGEVPYWTIETGEGSIGMESPGRGINGGLAQREGPAPEAGAAINGCNVVIGVDDADATFAKGLELGGMEAVAPEDLQGVGRVGYLRDPDGNLFGVISEVLSDGSSPMRAADAEDPMQVTPEP